MTILYAFQAKKIALVASDLLMRFIPREQIGMPIEETDYTPLICEKFRRNNHGDRVAYGGRLNSDEVKILESLGLEELITNTLCNLPGFGQDRSSNVLYVSINEAQVYAGTTKRPLQPLTRGTFMISSDELRYATGLQNISREFSSVKHFDKDIFRKLSDRIEKYFMNSEAGTESFGGFVSYLVSPGKFKVYSRNPGKLRGSKEAEVREGLVFFED